MGGPLSCRVHNPLCCGLSLAPCRFRIEEKEAVNLRANSIVPLHLAPSIVSVLNLVETLYHHSGSLGVRHHRRDGKLFIFPFARILITHTPSYFPSLNSAHCGIPSHSFSFRVLRNLNTRSSSAAVLYQNLIGQYSPLHPSTLDFGRRCI